MRRLIEIEKPYQGIVLDWLFCFFLYLFAVTLPAPSYLEQSSLTGALRFIFLPVFFLLLRGHGIKPNMGSPKKALLCMPLLLLSLGNIASLLVNGGIQEPNHDALTRLFVFSLGTAVAEEIIFRYGLMEGLGHTNLAKFDILISASIFGLAHSVGFFTGGAPMMVLAQIGYTSLFGLLLGVAYKFGGIIPAVLLHFAFNFLQNDLFVALGGGEWNAMFFVFNIAFYLACAGYALLLFLHLRRKAK